MKSLLLMVMFLFSSLSYGQALFKRVKGEIYLNSKRVDLKSYKTISLKINDMIEARGKGSFCQVVLENGTTFLLRNGKMKLQSLKMESTIIGVFQGTFFASVEKGNKDSFRVKTKSASLGVRGTKFYVEVDDKSTYLCVCEGKVEFINKTGRKTLGRLEDVKAQINEPLKTTSANKMMLKMSKEGFALMGINLNIDGSEDW